MEVFNRKRLVLLLLFVFLIIASLFSYFTYIKSGSFFGFGRKFETSPSIVLLNQNEGLEVGLNSQEAWEFLFKFTQQQLGEDITSVQLILEKKTLENGFSTIGVGNDVESSFSLSKQGNLLTVRVFVSNTWIANKKGIQADYSFDNLVIRAILSGQSFSPDKQSQLDREVIDTQDQLTSLYNTTVFRIATR